MATFSTQEEGGEGTEVSYTRWIDVQKTTFTNWVNEKLKGTPYKVEILEKDLDDGVTLIKLLETLANKKMHKRYCAKPQNVIHRRENVQIALEFITKVENIKLENIGVSDITGHNLTLILALVWALILRYQMVKRQPDTVESRVGKEEKIDETADKLLLEWMRMILPGKNINNLTSAWSDGRNLSALVDHCKPGLIPYHASLDPKNRLENVRHAMTLAEQHLNIPQVMHPEDLAVDHPDKLSTMTYLSQFWWRSRHQLTSSQQGEDYGYKESPNTQLSFIADLEMRLKAKEEELQLLKQQAEREKEELQTQLEMVTKRDQEHKKQLESVKREMDQNVFTMQEERMQLELERLSQERELLKRDNEVTEHRKELQSVQLELQTVKQKMQSMEEKHKTQLTTEKKVLEKELEFERLLKEQELQKKEKEITEHKKQLQSVRKQLETDMQKLSPPQEEEMAEGESQDLETISLKALSYVDPALRKNHRAYFRGFFLLRTTVIVNGQLAQIGPNEQGWLTLRCPTTNASITFNDLYTKVTAAMQKYNGIHISNYWGDDVPLFQLNVSSTDSLQKLLKSKSNLQKDLTEQISQMFKKKTQVQLQPHVFLILPSASGGKGKIVHVTADNAAQSMAEWEGSAAFTFQDVFQQWDDHSRRNEPTLGTGSVRELIEALEEVVEWFQFGIHLGIPHYKLSIIKADNQGVEECKRVMLQWWLDNCLEAKWSVIVQALVKAGKRVLAHEIALEHGIPTEDYSNNSEAAPTVEPPADMDWKEKLAEMESNIKAKNLALARREEDLKVSQQKREALTHEMADIRKTMESAQRRVEELLREKDALERELRLKQTEIEVLRLKNSSIASIKEQEIVNCQKHLDTVRQELEEEKKKISPLQEELQRKRVEVAEKMKDIQYLTEARDRATSELEREREKAEQKSKKLTAAAISHAVHTAELQIQLASLKENKERNDHAVDTLQKTVEKKEVEIEHLLQQVAAKEGEMKQQSNTLHAVELKHTKLLLEVEVLKMKIMQLEHERDSALTAAKLAREEAHLYAETLIKASKLALKWSNRKKAPEPMYRGAAVVNGTIAYVIGAESQIIYSYRLDRDKWNKHSECPHINPGLVIINDLLTVVGGKKEYDLTNILTSWNRKKWVEVFPPMQTPRVSPAVVHYGDYVIAVGGDREKREVELLHVPSLLWSTVTSLPRPLSDISTALCEDSIIAMDYEGSALMINVKSLNAAIRLEGSSTEHSQWMSLPKCPVDYGTTLSSLSGQPLALGYDGIFQLQERQWMVVVGGSLTSTDAVRVAVIV